MTARFRIVLLVLLSIAAPASVPTAAGQTQKEEDDLASPSLRVGWSEFKELYDAKRIEVVDVRGKDSFKAGHIPGARSVPLEEVENRLAELGKLKRPIVTYCA